MSFNNKGQIVIDPRLRERNWDEILELSTRTQYALKNDNIVTFGDLAERTCGELLKMPNFGRKSLEELKFAIALAEKNLPSASLSEQKTQHCLKRVSVNLPQHELAAMLHKLLGGELHPAAHDFGIESASRGEVVLSWSEPLTVKL